jgi:hypothetical protein
MKPLKQHTNTLLIFIPLIVGFSIVYHYPDVLLKRPQSIHNWRQCDGASIALCYYQNGMHFFRPQTHMLYSDNYTTGFTSTSEIPVLYYFVAILYKVFGYHDFIFRSVNLLIFFIGLFYLFRLAYSALKDYLYAAIVTMLIFSSPLLVYYGNNFLPNTVALSFSFIGWYHFYRYHQTNETRFFLRMVLFFGIASCMKITELTGPIIVITLMLADRLKIIKLKLASDRQIFIKTCALSFVFALVGGWVFYAKYYNSQHNSFQFSTYIFPFWEMRSDEILEIFRLMRVLWIKDYFYIPTLWFMLISLLTGIIFYKRGSRILLLISVFLILALISFSLLWFQALGQHDYFFIGFYTLPAVLFINFFRILKSFHISRYLNLTVVVIFLAFVTINVIHAQKRHAQRYHGSWMNDYDQTKDLYTIKPWLDKNGFSKSDTIIYYPSFYIRPLYLMNLKGWVIYNHNEITKEIEVRDSAFMKKFSENGADYFITGDLKSAAAYKPFQSYMKDLYLHYNSIYIFRLPPRNFNFNPSDTISIDSLINIQQHQ